VEADCIGACRRAGCEVEAESFLPLLQQKGRLKDGFASLHAPEKDAPFGRHVASFQEGPTNVLRAVWNLSEQASGSYTSENVMKLVSKTRQNIIRILYVKIRGSGAGFWGLNTNQVRAFKAQGHQWDVVLLLGPGERSYLGTSQNVEEGFEEWGSSAADYKVHEPEIEGSFAQFDSYAELFFRLLPPAILGQTVALDRTSARTLGPGVACGESAGITTQLSRKH